MLRVAGSDSAINKALSVQVSYVTVWTNAGTAATAPKASPILLSLLRRCYALTAPNLMIKCTPYCTALTLISLTFDVQLSSNSNALLTIFFAAR